MKRLYPIEIVDGKNRIGLSDMISRATYKDVTTIDSHKELIDWLTSLGVTSELFVKIRDRTYVLTETCPADLLKPGE